MIDLLINVLDPSLKYFSSIDVNSVIFQRLVETSSALSVVLVVLLLIGIFKVLTAFFR